MNYATLRALIVQRPSVKALAELGADNAVADALNAESTTVVERISVSKGRRWLALCRRIKLQRAADNVALDDITRSLAQSAIDLIESATEEITLDAEFMQLFAALIPSVLSEADKTSFLSAAAEQVPLTVKELGREINAHDVSESLAADRQDHIVGGELL